MASPVHFIARRGPPLYRRSRRPCQVCGLRPAQAERATCKRCRTAAERRTLAVVGVARVTSGRFASRTPEQQLRRDAGPPCPYPPGSPGKVAWLAMRAVEGRPLFSPLDDSGRNRKDVLPVFRIGGRSGRIGETKPIRKQFAQKNCTLKGPRELPDDNGNTLAAVLVGADDLSIPID